MISPTQTPLPDKTQHSQDTDIHAPGGIRTRNPSKRAAADPRLRQRGHWDQLVSVIGWHNFDNLSFAIRDRLQLTERGAYMITFYCVYLVWVAVVVVVTVLTA